MTFSEIIAWVKGLFQPATIQDIETVETDVSKTADDAVVVIDDGKQVISDGSKVIGDISADTASNITGTSTTTGS